MAVCCGKCFTDSNGTSFQDSIVREMGTKAGFGGHHVSSLATDKDVPRVVSWRIEEEESREKIVLLL